MRWIKVLVGVMTISLILSGCGEKRNNANESTKKEELKQEVKEKTKEKEEVSVIDSLVLKEGHPTYYGDLEGAKKFSKEFSKKTVVVDDSYKFDSEKTILNIDGYDEIIRTIQIYLDTANERATEEEALKIAKAYLPKDILDKYYSEPIYEKYVPEDTSKNIYKVIHYGITEEGSKKYYEKEHKYQGAVTVIFEEDSQGIKTITMGFGKQKWMFSAKMNGYVVEEWNTKDISISK